jgi:pimeloyl-ACP methyl ester carboxylesterase
MAYFKRIIHASLTILVVLAAAACAASAPPATPTPFPTATPTPENTPLPTATPTPENTPLPAATPTMEFQQRPPLPTTAMEGVIDVGGHKLRYQCFGEGSPTIIVETGGGDKPTLTMSWNAVIKGVISTTRICIYDREDVNTSQDVAENLHGLLTKIPLPGPYILVAHSIGGWYARVFAHLYPKEVAGMILVDTTPTYPDSTIIIATAYPTASADEPAGITQNRLSEADLNTLIPPSIDGLDMKTSNEQVRQAGSFGDIPLVVISQAWRPEEFPGRDPVTQKLLAAIMLKVEADLVNLSSRGAFIVAHTSNHWISMYEPQIIIDAITRMVKEIRNQ